MDFANFASLGSILAQSDNVCFVLYAVATCLLTEAVKKLFVNKAKVNVLHRFDLTPLLPFIFGLAFAAVDVFAVKGQRTFDMAVVYRLALSAVTIGALASTLFRCVKSLSGGSLDDLMKNDVFAVFYTQLLYFGKVRQQIEDKKLSFADFIGKVKLLSAEAESIYAESGSADEKRCRLGKLLCGIIDDGSLDACLNVLNEALQRITKKST